MIVGLFILLARLNVSDLPAPVLTDTDGRGNVCVVAVPDFRDATRCRPTEHGAFDTEARGYFIWRSDKGAFLWLGRAERDSRVMFDPRTAARLSLQIHRPESRNLGSRTTTLTLTDISGRTWIVPFTPESIDRLQVVALPAGKYDLAIATSGYWTAVRRGIVARQGALVEIPGIKLDPLPQISGVVRDRQTGEPIAGATIDSGSQILSTLSDTAGHFTLRPSIPGTTYITVRAAGYASRDVALTPTRPGAALPPIFLAHGGSLRATLQRECADDCAITAVLFRRHDAEPPPRRWKQLDKKTSSGHKTEYRFDWLAEGSYALVFQGSGPLQRKVAYFAIDHDEPLEKSFTANDRLIAGVVTLGTAPLPKATLTFSTNQLLWSGQLHTDDKGEYSATVWEDGNWTMRADVPLERDPFFSVRHLNDTAEQFWDVAIPVREMTGHVFDADTNEPVVGADVFDDVLSKGAHRGLYSSTDADGKFRFAMLDAGSHSIHVDAQGYLDRAATHVEIVEADSHRELQIALDHGVRVYFRIVDQQGAAVPNAELYDWVGDVGLENHSPYISDVWGLIVVPVQPGQQKPIYVITRRGSFNFAVADSSSKTAPDKPVDVRLDPPLATLTLSATAESRPAGGVQFLVRVNGHFLPPRIWDMVTGSIGGAVTMTGRDGRVAVPSLPVGTYEFWPYRTLDDLRKLFVSVHVTAPTRAMLAPGPNVVEVVVNAAH